MQPRARKMRVIFALAAAAVFTAPTASAQQYAHLDLGGTIEVGGEAERYARLLELAGRVPLVPWSIQPFSPVQVNALKPAAGRAHPWMARFAIPSAGIKKDLLRPSGRLIGNTAFPYQISGGPTWAGRGLTADFQFGALGNWGPVYAQLAPIASVTQNAAFDLAPNGQTGDGRFADPRFPRLIDAPQRFGSTAFGRLSPGSSSLVLDAQHVLLGVSSAPQRWGPQLDFPLVLGPNAGGFPTIYAGSDEPLNLWLFRAHARLMYGRLTQSALAPDRPDDPVRLAEGLVVVAEPRGVPGLEVGGARFIHRPWNDRSFSALARPISGIITINGSSNDALENQLASVFARWAFPAVRSEFYGEFYREDYPTPFHNGGGSLIEHPDDLASFALGFQTLFASDDDLFRVLRGELVNGETSHTQRLERGFITPLPPYIHSREAQGHTYDGLILGSPEAYGGSGWSLAVDQISPTGRISLGLRRSLRFDWLPTRTSAHPDVQYSLRADFLRFSGAREFGITVVPTYELNRDLVDFHDAFNLTVGFTARGW